MLTPRQSFLTAADSPLSFTLLEDLLARNQSWLLTATLESVKIIWRGGAVW